MARPTVVKNWVFTLNNPTEEEEEAIKSKVPGVIKYLIYQKETGESGTPHLQGYAQFVQKVRFTQVKNHIGQRAFVDKRKGSHDEARDYCRKEEGRIEDPVELGEPTLGRGQRNDLLAVKAALDAGGTVQQVADNHFEHWVKYSRAFKEYVILKRQKNRDWITFTTVYWGEPGVGKTRRIVEEAGANAYWLPKPCGQNIWFDGYDGEEDVVIDEFYGWIPRDLMQRMCDRYPLLVPTKGGFVPFLAKRIWITSNAAPDNWWPRLGLGAMRRRLTGDFGTVLHMDVPWVPVGVESEDNAGTSGGLSAGVGAALGLLTPTTPDEFPWDANAPMN